MGLEDVVYIVDDDPIFSRHTSMTLSAAGYLPKTFTTGVEFLKQTTLSTPACVLMDIEMPDLGGQETQKALAARKFPIPVIFITSHPSVPLVVDTFRQGALDFLVKPIAKDALLAAVERAITSAREKLLLSGDQMQIRRKFDHLTPREVEVFRWILTGKPNKQIAEALKITERTVKAHRAMVMEKMDVHSVVELVRIADQIGLLEPVDNLVSAQDR